MYDGTTLTWSAIGSTTTISNIGEAGAPVYLAVGTEVTTSDTSTGRWSGSVMNNLDQDLNKFSNPIRRPQPCAPHQ